MGIFFSFLAIAFFTAMYLLLGQSQKRGSEPMGINVSAFITGAVISFALALPVDAGSFPGRLIVIGSLIGITAGLGLLATTLAVRLGASVSIVNGAVSMCLIVPVLLSAALYGETPNFRKWFGVALAIAAIVLVQRERR
jgi:drug/metabolite transporter (DMT)-like permease